METPGDLSSLAQKLLISCGIISPMLYLGTDWLAGRLLKGYSFTAQSISELSAAGSPTRSLVVSLTFVAGLLLIAFGIGVWKVAGQTLLPRIVSGLVIGNVLAGLIASIFFPTRFGERPIFGSVGVILMFFSVLFFILAMVIGAVAFSGWFRVLSIYCDTVNVHPLCHLEVYNCFIFHGRNCIIDRSTGTDDELQFSILGDGSGYIHPSFNHQRSRLCKRDRLKVGFSYPS